MRKLTSSFLSVIVWFAVALGAAWAGVEENKKTDREHMEKIREALFKYHDEHGELPAHLSDLVPDYLPDKAVLVSPAENVDRPVGPGAFPDPKLPCSYGYEFNHNGDDAQRSPLKTKYAQMEAFGDLVPILRCFCYAQNEVLNLSYGGEWFETELFWETSPAVKELLKKAGKVAAPKDGATFVVHCQDKEKQPLAGVSITVSGRMFQNLPLPEVTVESDAKGDAKVPLGPDGKSTGLLEFEKEGYNAEMWTWETMKPDAVHTVIFDTARRIGGVVRNAQGEPIKDANVGVFGSVKEDQQWIEKQLATKRTDADGRWTYNSLQGDAKNLSLAVTAAECFKLDLFAEGDEASHLDEEKLREGKLEVKLAPAVQVAVKLKGEAGSVLPSAKAWGAFSPDGDLNESSSMSQLKFKKLEPEAKFAFGEPGDFWALVVPDGFAPTVGKLRVMGKDLAMEVALDQGRSVSGEVLNAKNEPAAGAKIYVHQMGRVEPDDAPQIAETDAAGKFTWPHAPANSAIMLEVKGTVVPLSSTAKSITIRVKE